MKLISIETFGRKDFISKMEGLPDKEIQLRQIGLPFDRIRAVALLKEIYI